MVSDFGSRKVDSSLPSSTLAHKFINNILVGIVAVLLLLEKVGQEILVADRQNSVGLQEW